METSFQGMGLFCEPMGKDWSRHLYCIKPIRSP